MKASQIRKGMKIREGRGYREMDEVTPKGTYMWCEYREYDAKGNLVGHFGSSYPADKRVTRIA